MVKQEGSLAIYNADPGGGERGQLLPYFSLIARAHEQDDVTFSSRILPSL